MALYDVPERFCPKGHKITRTEPIVKKTKAGNLIVTGYVNSSRLICEECAIMAGGGELLDGVKHRPLLKKLEKAGQESFLSKVPAKFID